MRRPVYDFAEAARATALQYPSLPQTAFTGAVCRHLTGAPGAGEFSVMPLLNMTLLNLTLLNMPLLNVTLLNVTLLKA